MVQFVVFFFFFASSHAFFNWAHLASFCSNQKKKEGKKIECNLCPRRRSVLEIKHGRVIG